MVFCANYHSACQENLCANSVVSFASIMAGIGSLWITRNKHSKQLWVRSKRVDLHRKLGKELQTVCIGILLLFVCNPCNLLYGAGCIVLRCWQENILSYEKTSKV